MRMKTRDLITKEECLTSEEVADLISKRNIQFYVYFLVDPFSYEIKYVGKGSNIRCLDHFKNRSNISKKDLWLNKLAKRCKEPLYIIWEFYNDEQVAYEQERNFISMLGRKGIDNKGILLNAKRGQLFFNDSYDLDYIKERIKLLQPSLVIKSSYKGMVEPLEIKCLKCKSTFLKSANDIINKKQGCAICSGQSKQLDVKSVKAQFKVIHGNLFDYNEFKEYLSDKQKITIFCNRCKQKFTQKIGEHKQGAGCNSKSCIAYKISKGKTKDTDYFLNKFYSIFGKELFDTSEVVYKGQSTKVKIICKSNGCSVWVKPEVLYQGAGLSRLLKRKKCEEN